MAVRFTVFSILTLTVSGLSVFAKGDSVDGGKCWRPYLMEVVFSPSDKCYVQTRSETAPALNPSRVSQLDEESLERALDLLQFNNAYMALLFHASWCPFSKAYRSLFDILSSLFPNIHHVAVEESAVMPSALSRYGVHSFPSLFLQNQTSRLRYYGSRDLESLVLSYKEITGIEPVTPDLAKDYGSSVGGLLNNEADQSIKQSLYPWKMPPEKLLQQEPYLIFAVLFLASRILVYLISKVLTRVKSCHFERMWHLDLALLSENMSPFMKHALHAINLKRIWSRLNLSKTRNFQEGAKNARVWASSLASVSLGKGPTNRSVSSSESH